MQPLPQPHQRWIETPAMASASASVSASELIPVLPDDTGIQYLGEGAANIVYHISVRYPTPPPSLIEEYGDGTPPPSEIEDVEDRASRAAALHIFDNKLLRLRKDLPTTAPCAVAQENWLRLVAPLFDADQLVQQSLVQIRTANVIEKLNKELNGWEHNKYPLRGSLRSVDPRPTQRHGIYLADDEHGLLVTDMTPGSALNEEVHEFKPKWLLQSPSAPPGSIRCRQCARNARMKAIFAREYPHLAPNKYFCPLDLVSEDRRAIALVASQMDSVPSKALILRRWLESNTLLKRLRDAQRKLDPKGIFLSDPTTEDFCVAMTLRDCTVFLRLSGKGKEGHIEARLGDLDVKCPDKAEYWKATEQQLIDEGWYTGTEKAEDRQPLLCSLSSDRWKIVNSMRNGLN
ncbi:hypothetical protein G7Y89_g14918 [Cudoniella acicularis]|uniref:Inositol-pentakisphosphate 2-kinase n=1 Tax=Cudoniella acicularis TaxID=354080 RepID=A0A8H4VPP6_9HELO|nr:hypothetical protein G7Y89_g14918 [Cudoniella acicularis]